MAKYFFAETSIRGLPEAQLLSARYPEMRWIDDYQAFRFESMHREKECVIFARKRGPWMKPFHCYHQSTQYSYFSMDVAEGCPFDCVYCYLQTYLNHGALVLFVNQEDLFTELQQVKNSKPWISTGLLSDSLLSESYFPLLPQLSHAIPDGAILELRSKSDQVRSLNSDEIERRNIVISWSLNPEQIAERYEFRASPLKNRLEAARLAIEWGYRIGFHFDPIFYFQNWKEAYRNLIDQVFAFSTDRIAFISIGLFRYMPDLGRTIRNRFPMHPILSEEFFLDIDGKYHYFRPIRKQMYRVFSEWFKEWQDKGIPIFWSMEPDSSFVAPAGRDALYST
ncbi:MAG: hypothetical protein C5B54_02775 [Acidobacteria bacterium]|nr:MAG: hypothetical protein C5B54_02775 [Acidobacteriota bacterium]